MKMLVTLAILLFSPAAWAEDGKMKLLDEEIVPFVHGLSESGVPPGLDELMRLGNMVRQFNESPFIQIGNREVTALKPLFLQTFLNEEGVQTAALAFCAGNMDGVRPCNEAAQYLRDMTAQCVDVFLGTIDLEAYPNVPLDKFDAAFGTPGDPNLILMAPNAEMRNVRSVVRIRGTASPDTVAVVLCPEESDAFKHVFKALPGR